MKELERKYLETEEEDTRERKKTGGSRMTVHAVCKEEKVNMCKAIDDWIEEAKTEGREEGRIEEQKNTEMERNRADAAEIRADAAETRAREAEKENQRLKVLLKEMGYCF